MKTIEDLLMLLELCPRSGSESPLAWLSRARGEGWLKEEEWNAACRMLRTHGLLMSYARR